MLIINHNLIVIVSMPIGGNKKYVTLENILWKK